MGRLRGAAAADDGAIASINIIPFVDIVLVLLVIFMLTSAAIVRATMKVDLPKAATGGQTVASTVNLVIVADGSVMLNGAPTTLDAAVAFVRAEVKARPDLQAVIAADQGVPYGRVMTLVFRVNPAGGRAYPHHVARAPAAGE
jgi:biopolymer transport protein ExbD